MKTNNLNYSIDLTFNKVNRLFVLSFKDEEEYYTSKVEIKDFNVLVDGIFFLFFWHVSRKQRRSIRKNYWDYTVKIMIIQLVIYWTMGIFQSIIN